MPTRLPSALSVLLAAMVAASAQAGDPPSLEVVGAWGGPVNAVAFDGNIACVGSGRRLVVLDVGDINNFVELAALDLGNTVEDLAVRDGYAFVVTQTAPHAFCVVDVSVPARPALAWSSSSLPSDAISQPRQVQLRGDYAYVRVGGSGGGDVIVFNIANPRNPVLQGGVGFIYDINDFAIAGDFIYFAAAIEVPGIPGASPWISIHDLTANPSQPLQVGSLLLFDPAVPSGETPHLAVAGTYVYALAKYGGGKGGYTKLAVIDVSNPRAPKLASDSIQFQNPYEPIDLAAEPGRLYITNSSNSAFAGPEGWAIFPGLLIYDIAKPGGSPAAPAFVKSYKTHGSIFGVQPAGAIAWLLDAGEGLIALDVTNPAAPLRRDNYHSPAYLKKMDKVGDRLYVSDLWNGFTILNVADPAAPQVLGVYRTPMVLPPFGKGDPVNNGIVNWGIEVRDNRAYLAAGYAGIHVVNVANPASPNKMGGSTPALPGGTRATAIELDGDFAHLGVQSFPGGLYNNYNITDITPPTIVLPLVGSAEIGGGADTIATRQGFSYLAINGVLMLVDTTVPSKPLFVDDMRLSYAADLAIADDLIYLAVDADIAEGLYIYNLSRRDAPSFEGFYPGTNSCAVALQNQRAYLVGFFGGYGADCIALDVSELDQPQPFAFTPNVGVQSESVVFVDEPNVFITSASGALHSNKGLVILELEGCLDSAGDADFNCDGVVNGFDLGALLGQWTGSAFYSPCPPHLPADLSHDCRVNGGDLAILLGDWG